MKYNFNESWMSDSSEWNIDDNGLYVTKYIHTAASELAGTPEIFRSDTATTPLSEQVITFDNPTDIIIKYAVGVMGEPSTNPISGIYYYCERKVGQGTAITPDTMLPDTLLEGSVDSILSNPIELEEQTLSLTGVTKLKLMSKNKPVVWIDHIQIVIDE